MRNLETPLENMRVRGRRLDGIWYIELHDVAVKASGSGLTLLQAICQAIRNLQEPDKTLVS